jgi:hypothetical protein
MNIYDALNQGDGSLKEPHFTSLLFYLFKVSKDEFPENSFLDLFIERFAPGYPNSNECDFDLETDIKIEEILIHSNLRRDTDIVVFLRQKGLLRIINIENKITNLSYQSNQIFEQHSILSSLYPNAEIKNILILPFSSEQIILQNENVSVIYWLDDKNSLIEAISGYINETIDKNNLKPERLHFLKSFLGLFEKFSFILEQDRLSNENMPRGPRNILRLTMFEYLSDIANNWENRFVEDPENVRVSQLLQEFERVVIADLREDFPENCEEKIAKFKRGALEAQPKIMTINERNRIHFNITNPNVKKLFYYPDAPNGNYAGRWKDERIKPLRLMNEEDQYLIYWKDSVTNDIQTDIYIP